MKTKIIISVLILLAAVALSAYFVSRIKTMEYSSRSSPLWRILADLKPNDHAKLKNVLDDQEQVIPPLPTNPPPRFSFLGTPPPI